MRPIQHAAIVGGIVIAAAATIGLRESTVVAQPQPEPARTPAREARIGTVDTYRISERIMQQPRLQREREQGDEQFQERMRTIENEMRELETRAQVLPQTDPRFQELVTRAQALEADYQRIQGERQQELERINSRQLIAAFDQTRIAAEEFARQRGYTHIFSARSFDRPVETTTVGATLQELLARPIIVGIPEDDLTDAILDRMQLEPVADGDAQPGIEPLGPGR
jgi:Skp family chaperone for outer membrane proteins